MPKPTVGCSANGRKKELYCLARYNGVKIPNIKGHTLLGSTVLPTVAHDNCLLLPFQVTFLA